MSFSTDVTTNYAISKSQYTFLQSTMVVEYEVVEDECIIVDDEKMARHADVCSE